MSSSGLPVAQPSTVWIGCIPKEGLKVLPLDFDFTAATDIDVNLFTEQGQAYISQLQALYVDNSANGAVFEISCNVVRQHIVIPANKCAYMPLLQPNPPKVHLRTTGGVIVRVHFMNFFMPPLVF